MWLSACPEIPDEERPGALARSFINSEVHRPDGGVRCVYLTARFKAFCIAKVGRLPVGWRKALWRVIKADGRFVLNRQSLEFNEQVRMLDGW